MSSHHPPSKGVGGAGGVGRKITLKIETAYLSEADHYKIGGMWMNDFCTKYKIDPVIRDTFIARGFPTIGSVLVATEDQWKHLEIKAGWICEITWAVKEFFLTHNIPWTVSDFPLPILEGGVGGRGGDGGDQGGAGGEGYGINPELSQRRWLARKGPLHGGIGGPGGDCVPRYRRITETPETTREVKVPNLGPDVLIGGIAGPGGFGTKLGGDGGVGEGNIISMFALPRFRKIMGGFGGTGGVSASVGGQGGHGHAPDVIYLIHQIDDATRSLLPRTELKDLNLDPQLNAFLSEQGFYTAGGLLETYMTELNSAPGFKPGYPFALRDALKRFCFKHQRRHTRT
ncbi:hypothetical protein R3P38DRAFT_330572 [Favolaschia claudopus]|uniref:Uncharacterized protein n=1 Tax=Favolaschia claudopus TaxID=2862362 RepID=A0AAV9ZM61_9AGAR